MTTIGRTPVLWIGIAIGAVMAAGRLAGGGTPAEAALTFAIVAGYSVLVTLLARRSETAGLLAGRPADERWEHISLEACALAFGVSGVAALGGFVIADATGGAWQPWAFIASVMAASYAGSLLWVRSHH